MRSVLLGLALAVSSLFACGGAEEPVGTGKTCTPGETQACFCASASGAQACKADGSGFEACTCGAAGAGGAAGASSGSAGAPAGAAGSTAGTGGSVAGQAGVSGGAGSQGGVAGAGGAVAGSGGAGAPGGQAGASAGQGGAGAAGAAGSGKSPHDELVDAGCVPNTKPAPGVTCDPPYGWGCTEVETAPMWSGVIAALTQGCQTGGGLVPGTDPKVYVMCCPFK